MQPLPSHGPCFVCGSGDTPGMGVTWYVLDNGSIFSEVTLGRAQQGPPGFGHGGASAALLDEAMGAAVWLAGHRAASINLNISYHKPVPLGQLIRITAWVKEENGKKITAAGEIHLEKGSLVVSGEGIFVQAPHLFTGFETEASKKIGAKR